MGCQMENDRKSYRFLFGTFFDRGVHFEKQRRYEENKHYGCVQSSRTVRIASCKLKLIIFIMFKVQVQPSRKHKYHNNSTKKRGCSRDTSYLSRSPLRQHRTKPACRLCAASADEFSVISHRNSLQYASIPASFLCNLTKNLLAHLPHILCAVLP